MTDRQLADLAISHLKQTTITYGQWQNKMAAGAYPDITLTHWWQAIDALGRIQADPDGWARLQPRPPITRITALQGLGLNVNDELAATYHDYVIDGTGDSGILLQGATSGCRFDRIDLKRIAVTEAVTWAKHGVYCKARGNQFADLLAENGGHAVSGLSVRMGNNTFLRTVLTGFTHSFTYYEQDGKPGHVMVKDADWHHTGDTAIWGDDSNEPPTPYIKQTFAFFNVSAEGPGPWFLKFGSSTAGGPSYRGAGVTINHCTLNGRPVDASMVSGVPANLLHIS